MAREGPAKRCTATATRIVNEPPTHGKVAKSTILEKTWKRQAHIGTRSYRNTGAQQMKVVNFTFFTLATMDTFFVTLVIVFFVWFWCQQAAKSAILASPLPQKEGRTRVCLSFCGDVFVAFEKSIATYPNQTKMPCAFKSESRAMSQFQTLCLTTQTRCLTTQTPTLTTQTLRTAQTVPQSRKSFSRHK